MADIRLVVVTDNDDFQANMQNYLRTLQPQSEAYLIPAPMRAMGVISMLHPTHVALDLSLVGIDIFIADIKTAVDAEGAQFIFFASGSYQQGENIARSANALWSPYSTPNDLVDWIIGGCKPVPVEAPATDEEKIVEKIESEGYTANLENLTTPQHATPPKKEYTMLPSPGKTAKGERLPSMDELLVEMLDNGGSDLHISVGTAPRYRVNGELVEIPNTPKLFGEDTEKIIAPILNEKRLEEYETTFECDFSYSIPGRSRFRVNVFRQRGAMGAVLRTIPFGIPTIEQLGLPEVCRELADKPRGLVLVTGPTGSGKSTTLAAMIDYINENKAVHIMTMEDPIEFMHRNKKALVNQREVGEDTESFAAALKHVLRQDPDVILVGEMRDLETISAAITAAETGHLVFGTLHTIGGPETIDRIIDVFPPAQQNQIRMQLSGSLQGVLSQVLCPVADGKGRTLAMEVMLGVPAIGNLIREGKTHQMESIIQSSGGLGMTTLDHSLRNLVASKKITAQTAIEKSKDPKSMAEALGYKY